LKGVAPAVVAMSPPDIPASNFVHIERKREKIRGQFVIDPTMPLPTSFFEPVGTQNSNQASSSTSPPPGIPTYGSPSYELSAPFDEYQLKDGKPRPNLLLQSPKGIDVEVWLVSPEPSVFSSSMSIKQKKALLNLLVTEVNWITTNVKIQALEEQLFTLNITYDSNIGTIRLWIPSSFVGPVTIDNGTIRTSAVVKSKFSTISQVENKHRCFIGDIRSFTAAGQREWAGSSINLRFQDGGNGKVDLRYVDEVGDKKGCCIQ